MTSHHVAADVRDVPGTSRTVDESTLVLGIETSCDETAAALVLGGYDVVSSVVSTQVDLHADFGGVVPEIASRAHLDVLNPVIARTIVEAGVDEVHRGAGDLDAVQQRLPLGVQPGERRQQRRVDIHPTKRRQSQRFGHENLVKMKGENHIRPRGLQSRMAGRTIHILNFQHGITLRARKARDAGRWPKARHDRGQDEIDEKIGQKASAGSAPMPPELPEGATGSRAIGRGTPNQHNLRRMGFSKLPHGVSTGQTLQRE